MIDFWTKTSGTWINIATVLIGTILGLLLRDRISKSGQEIITQAVGLLTVFLGLKMAQSLSQGNAGIISGIILGLICLVFGGILGEYWQIQERLNYLGDWLQEKFQGGGDFTEGFVVASLLFCVGPLTLIGSINNGLNGDYNLLAIKSTMDGLASIALTGSYGIGVGFSVLVILVYQGGLSLVASLLTQILPDPASDPRIFLITGVGGIMILGLGLNLLNLTKIKIASFLPALFLAPIFYQLVIYFN